MSTTVTYKGNTLTTAENQTRVLKTSGKYMEDDVTIVDVTSGQTPTEYIFTFYRDEEDEYLFVPNLSDYSDMVAAVQAGYDIAFVVGGEYAAFENAVEFTQFVATSIGPWSNYFEYYVYCYDNNDLMRSSVIYGYDGSTGTVHAEVVDRQYLDLPADLQAKTGITPTESSQTITADSGYDGLSSVQINAIPSNYVGSNIPSRSSSDLTVSGATVTAPSGYYASNASKVVASGTAGTPTATKGTVSNHSVSVTPSVTNTTGYIAGSTKTGVAVTVSASELVSGTKTITSSGTTDVTNYASVSVPAAVPFVDTRGQEFYTDPDDGKRKFRYRAMMCVDEFEGDTAGYLADGVTIYSDWYDHNAIPSGTVITPTKSTQTLGDGADVLEDAVTISPIPSQYIIPSGTLVCDDSGDWNVTEAATFRVQAGTEGTPTATKGSVSNHSVAITPSVTNTTGWIDGSTKTGTAVTVTASELVSGSETKAANGTYDVTNLAQVVVAVPIVTYYTGSSAPSSSLGSNGDVYLKTS